MHSKEKPEKRLNQYKKIEPIQSVLVQSLLSQHNLQQCIVDFQWYHCRVDRMLSGVWTLLHLLLKRTGRIMFFQL